MNELPPPVRYARARFGQTWSDARLSGLLADAAGDIGLRRLPSVTPPVTSTAGYPAPSGLALDGECGLYVADTAGGRVLRVALDCPATVAMPGQTGFCTAEDRLRPVGMAVGARGFLFVAGEDGHILVFGTPSLSLRDRWPVPGTPVALACHGESVVVVCTNPTAILRYDWRGRLDRTFTAPGDWRAVAIAPDGTTYLADAASGSVRRFDWSGAAAGPPLATGTQPTALTVDAGMLYVGDAATATVLCYALPDGDLLGPIIGYRGPVTALAAGSGGVYLKPGLDGSYLVAVAGSAYAGNGELTMGPLDAGLDTGWARAAVSCTQPGRTSVRLDWYTDPAPAPAVIDWQPARALDLLLPGGRYLWLRVTLSSWDPAVSPAVQQVQARTAGETYLDHLPPVYRHDPDQPGLNVALLDTFQPTDYPPGDLAYLQATYAHTPPESGFLTRLLELVRAQLGDLERAIDDLPSRFDPATAPAESLEWLASWLAFELPPRLRGAEHAGEVRGLLLELFDRYRRRGTPRGIADAVELYAGVRPHVFEEYQARPLWLLGETPLGFGTGMPDRDLEGVLVGTSVVGETGPADPAAFGPAAFASTAHRFAVVVPPARGLDRDTRALVTSVVSAERPAHTAFHLCFTEPAMRVGYQARVGVDAIVAAGPPPLALDSGAVLDGPATLPALPATAPGAVGTAGRLGIDTRTG